MKITIREDEKEFGFRVPLSLIPSKLVGHCMVKAKTKEIATGQEDQSKPVMNSKEKSDNISRFFKVLKQFARENPGWVLVEVESDDGEHVKIEL